MTESNRCLMIDEVVSLRRLKGRAEIVDSAGRSTVVPPSLYFATKTDRHPGDRLHIYTDEKGISQEIVKEVDDGLGNARQLQIYPYFQKTEDIRIGPFTIGITISEVDTSSDGFEELRSLNEFHYLPTKSTWGRQTLLGAWLFSMPQGIPFVPDSVVGYLILSSPGLVSGARNQVLGWTKQQCIANADRIARIARVVVHPEFRGLGIGRLLVRNALTYVGERWNVAGKSAWYVECIAEMGRYHPVFEKAGMHFTGETLGQRSNPKRLDTKWLRDTSQGVGHFRASMARYEIEPHPSKPYYIAAVQPDLESSLIGKVRMHEQPAGATRRVVSPAPAIGLVSVSYSPASPTLRQPIDADVHVLLARRADLGEDVAHVLATAGKLESELIRVATEIETSIEAVAVDTEALNDAHQEAVRRLRTLKASVSSTMPQETDLVSASFELNQALETLKSRLDAAAARLDRRRQDNGAANDESADWSLEAARQRLVELRNSLGHLRTSERERWVRHSFGDRATIGPPVIRDLNWDFPARSVVLITGPSGSGKTTLLKMLAGRLAPDQGCISPDDRSEMSAWLDLNLPDTHTLIDSIGSDINESVRLLNLVGMGEASVYLKRPSQLSHGQLYRAALAKIACSGKSVWIADEFCSSLDPVTAAIVARAFGRLAREYGASLFVATARPDIVATCLEPDIVLQLDLGGRVIPSPVLRTWKAELNIEALVQELERLEDQPNLPSEHAMSLGLVTRPSSPDYCATLRPEGTRLVQAARANLREAKLLVCKLVWERDLVFHRLFPPPQTWTESPGPERAELPGVPWVGRFRAQQVNLRKQVADQLRR